MLQLLICSDVHTYTDNLRLALSKIDRADAVLIAGDLEAEKDPVLEAVGSVPCYMVCGNNDYYLNTDYPEELLIDIADHPAEHPDTASTKRYPCIEKVTELNYSTLPSGYESVPSFFKKISPPFFLNKAAGDKKEPCIAHRILMTHGKEYNVPSTDLLSQRAEMWDADIIIFGHTHRFVEIREKNGKRIFINPGCLIGDPKATVRTWGKYETCSFAILRIGFGGEISVQHLFL